MIVKFDYFENYLFKRAEFWELMAFTRFRYIRGNKKLAEEALSLYYDRIANVKFTKSLVDSLVKIRKKMEEVAKGEIDIKVGAGGLVDVEFIAQILQLKHFKELGEIESHTVKALLKLSELKILNEDECKTLISNYEFYREVEKFLRVSLWRKSNSLPEPVEAQKLEYLSLCLGYRFADEFVDSIKSRMRKTRKIFEDVINRVIRR
jgi:glutamate-ammonia-ligase adenylyltransferase